MKWFSKDELEKIAQFEWNEEDLKAFISELIIFSTKERREILDDMMENSQVKDSKRYIKI